MKRNKTDGIPLSTQLAIMQHLNQDSLLIIFRDIPSHSNGSSLFILSSRRTRRDVRGGRSHPNLGLGMAWYHTQVLLAWSFCLEEGCQGSFLPDPSVWRKGVSLPSYLNILFERKGVSPPSCLILLSGRMLGFLPTWSFCLEGGASFLPDPSVRKGVSLSSFLPDPSVRKDVRAPSYLILLSRRVWAFLPSYLILLSGGRLWAFLPTLTFCLKGRVWALLPAWYFGL